MVVANLHIVEEYFVHMAVAARKLDRAHGDAWCLHVDPKIGEALVLRDGRVGAHDDDAIVAILRPARPHFLALILQAVAVVLGAGARPGKTRPAGGSGKEQMERPHSGIPFTKDQQVYHLRLKTQKTNNTHTT